MEIVLVKRQGCHLCDDALAALRSLGVEPDLKDVDADDQLHDLYDWLVPVVLVDGHVLLALAVSLSLAVVAHGGTAPVYSTVVIQPGDTVWSIAAEHNPSDDMRARVADIERANGLRSPVIEAGKTLRLPA